MSPDASPEALREWIASHLDPLEDGPPVDGVPFEEEWGGLLPDAPGEPTQAAVLVGLIEREQGLSVLLTRRADTLRSHTGQVALPGGRVDPGETVWEAALREAEEEVGLSREFVSLAGLLTPYRSGTNYLITPVVGFVSEGFSLTPNPAEVAEVFETPFGYLMEPSNFEVKEVSLPTGAVRKFYATYHQDQYIWGA
ncbi:MAG: CoA pyrophosphatase, partial [Phenylobacterium sp.]